MSKRIVAMSVAALFLSLGLAWAEVPVGRIAYQGRLTDSNNQPLTGTYSINFSIWDTGPGTGGTQLWNETQSLSVDRGLVSAELGGVSAIPGTLFNGATAYLEIKVGADAAMTPRIHLIASPYSYNSQTIQGYDFSALVTTFSAQTVGGNKTFSGTLNPGANLTVGGAGFKVSFASNVAISGAGPDALSVAGGLIAGSGNLTGTVSIGSAAVQGTVTSTSGFVGVGSTLTLLNASNLALGTVPDGLLSSNVVLVNDSSTLTTPVTFASSVTANSTVVISSLTVQGTLTSTSTFANARISGNQTTTATGNTPVTGMAFNVDANAVWDFEFYIQNGCSGTGGVRWALTFPAGATLRAVSIGMAAAVTAVTSSIITVSGTQTVAFNAVNSAAGWTHITGVVANGATAGSLQLQFASGTNGQTSTIFANSYFLAHHQVQ